jgi:hypothetical protein
LDAQIGTWSLRAELHSSWEALNFLQVKCCRRPSKARLYPFNSFLTIDLRICLSFHCPVVSCLVFSYRVVSFLVVACLACPCLALPCLVKSVPNNSLIAYVVGMDVSALYPVKSSIWTAPDGNQHDMQCSNRFSTSGGQEIECPDPFLRPVLPHNVNPCVYACPIHTFSASEYLVMSVCAVIPGMLGLFNNSFMALSVFAPPLLFVVQHFPHIYLRLSFMLGPGLSEALNS